MRDAQDPIFRAELRDMFGTDIETELRAKGCPYDNYANWWIREGVSPKELVERTRLHHMMEHLECVVIPYADGTTEYTTLWGLPDRYLAPSALRRRDLMTEYARHVSAGFEVPDSQWAGWNKRMDQIINAIEENSRNGKKLDDEARRAELALRKRDPRELQGQVKSIVSTDGVTADVLETAFRATKKDRDTLVALIQESVALALHEVNISKGRRARVRNALSPDEQRQLIIALHRHHNLEKAFETGAGEAHPDARRRGALWKLVVVLALGRDAWIALLDHVIEQSPREALLDWIADADATQQSDAELRRLVRVDLVGSSGA